MAKNKMTKDEAVELLVKSKYLSKGAYLSRAKDIVGEFHVGHGGGPEDLVNDAETGEDDSIDWDESDEDLDHLVAKVRKLDKGTQLFHVSANEAESFILFLKKPKLFKQIPDDSRNLEDTNYMVPVGKIPGKDTILVLALDG